MLFKWRNIRLDEKERFIWKGKTIIKHWEKKKKENYCDFRKPIREYFLDCNYRFVHCWIGLIFGRQGLHTWYFKLSGWIVKKISEEGDKCFAFFAFYFGISSSCFHCFGLDDSWFISLHWRRVFHVKQITSLVCFWFFFLCFIFYYYSGKVEGIYFQLGVDQFFIINEFQLWTYLTRWPTYGYLKTFSVIRK